MLRRPVWIVAGAFAVAALSLLAMRTPDFDPTAWLIWGDQIRHGTLSTLGGPSWKPLPVLFTTPFALLGDTAAECLWLVVARTGALLAVVLAFVLGRRLGGGRAAGAIAAAGLALMTNFLYNGARGDAEGLLVLAGLGAILLHLDGHRRAALLAGFAAALIRPEVWPMLGLYGLWMVRRERDAGTVVLVGGVGALLLAAWLVPEKAGSGEWLRAATRAQTPAEGSPAQTAFPFGAVFVNSAIAVPWPLYAGAAWAAWTGWRERRRDATLFALAVAATVLMITVALMAEAGFTGNLRYVTMPAALVCVLGGVGLPPLAARLRSTAPRLAAGLPAAVAVAASLYLLGGNAVDLRTDGRVYGRQLPQVIARAGGAEAIAACGPVGASHFATQMVARRLGLRQEQVTNGIFVENGTILATRRTGSAQVERIPLRFRAGGWVVRSSCALPSG